jgi:hypothetical protein
MRCIGNCCVHCLGGKERHHGLPHPRTHRHDLLCLGFHEYRERLIKNEWFCYEASLEPEQIEEVVTREDLSKILQKRRNEV